MTTTHASEASISCMCECLSSKAEASPHATPMTKEPAKMTPKYATALSSTPIVNSLERMVSMVRYSTMATASLSTDSPNTSAYKSGCTFIDWKMASTVTGSVALMSEP